MTILESLENALEFLEALGYRGGDIHDDLALAINRIRNRFPQTAGTEL
jgi:hypothetical protein